MQVTFKVPSLNNYLSYLYTVAKVGNVELKTTFSFTYFLQSLSSSMFDDVTLRLF
jgi:hypothetical protein